MDPLLEMFDMDEPNKCGECGCDLLQIGHTPDCSLNEALESEGLA